MVRIFIHDLQNRKIVLSHHMLFGQNLPINAFDDLSQTAYANQNTPNATGACVRKLYMK